MHLKARFVGLGEREVSILEAHLYVGNREEISGRDKEHNDLSPH